MTQEQLEERIAFSRRTLGAWREALPVGGPIDTTLDAIAKEIGLLRDLAANHPDDTARIGLLVLDWRDLGRDLRKD